MTTARPALPTHAELVHDLRLLRERGLLRVRRLSLPALEAAAHAAGLPGTDVRAVELLVRQAVTALGDEEPGQAGQYLFGLVQGTIGRRPTDLRERAARIYGVSAETFRKERERLLVDRIADEILRLCPTGPPGFGPGPPAAVPREGSTGDRAARHAVRAQLERALADVADRSARHDGTAYPFGRFGPFEIPFGAAQALLTVDLGAVEELRDVHLIVSSENTYLEPARLFTRTLSGQLRNAAAIRDDAGVVTYDTVAEELAGWVARHARPGNPVEPGLVVPTSPGRLSQQGVRRLLHAAVACPRHGASGYDVPDTGVLAALRGIFELARAERAADPAVRALTIPLFGAGDGGLTAEASFSRLWPGLRLELAQDPWWHVHLTTWTYEETTIVLTGLVHALDPGGRA